MGIKWKVPESRSPIIFKHEAKWDGIQLVHARALPGETDQFTHTRHEISVPLHGTLATTKHTAIGDTRTSFGKVGNVCLLPAGQPMSACWTEEIELVYFFLDQEVIINAATNLKLSKHIELVETYEVKDQLITELALALLAESHSPEPQGQLYAESLVQTLAFHLVRHYSVSNGAPPAPIKIGGLSGHKLRRATDFINEKLEEDLTLSEIAESVNLSPYHFARAFKRTTGLTPQQYLTERRIERAKRLLAESNLPIVEVGFRSGFKNQSHFTTLFRKVTTFTPKSWRELKLA